MITFVKKLQAKQPERHLRYRLHKHLKRFDEARPIFRIHASELTKDGGFCPRAFCLMDLTKTKPKGQWASSSDVATWEVGHQVQAMVVKWFAEMDVAVSSWKCVHCGQVQDLKKRPKACPACQCKRFDQQEPRFVSAISGASCGIDLLADLDMPKLVITEIKSIDPIKFKTLVAPLAEHRLRTALYLRIVAESGHPFAERIATDEARVLYVSKGGFGAQDPSLSQWGIKEHYSPFKEFTVKRDDALTEDVSRRAKAVKQFREGAAGMPTGICETMLCARAKACPVNQACFSGKYLAEVDWSKA